MAYWGFEDLHGRTVSDKVLHDKEFDTETNLKYEGYKRGIISIFYKIYW